MKSSLAAAVAGVVPPAFFRDDYENDKNDGDGGNGDSGLVVIEQELRSILARPQFDVHTETPKTIRSSLCAHFQVDPATLTKTHKAVLKALVVRLIKEQDEQNEEDDDDEEEEEEGPSMMRTV